MLVRMRFTEHELTVAVTAAAKVVAGGKVRRKARDDAWESMSKIERYHLLVVDEVGYLPLERSAANLLFALVATHAIIDMMAHAAAHQTGPQSLAHRMANAAPGSDADAAALAGLAIWIGKKSRYQQCFCGQRHSFSGCPQ